MDPRFLTNFILDEKIAIFTIFIALMNVWSDYVWDISVE